MSDKPFQLLHLQPDPQRLAAWAARHGLLDKAGDLGYALHGLLRAAFGERAPRAFRYIDAEQGLLAYTDLTTDELQLASALAAPEVAAALGLGATQSHGGFSARPFPTQWPSGHVLGFEVRVRPVIRQQKKHERDAFLALADKSHGVLIERADVYGEWLREHLARQGGAQLLDVTLERFQLLGVTRKSQKKNSGDKRDEQVVHGPDALLAGHIKVNDPEAFAALLARGIGRHRAFGFGLLMLRPARR